jgi:hypothetical protein
MIGRTVVEQELAELLEQRDQLKEQFKGTVDNSQRRVLEWSDRRIADARHKLQYLKQHGV